MEDNKIQALAKFLEVDAKTISNDYSKYYTVNRREEKRGTQPKEILQNVNDLKLLLTPGEKIILNTAIKARNSKKGLSTKRRDIAYKRITEALRSREALDQDAYDRIVNNMFHIENIVYWLLSETTESMRTTGSHYRIAWNGELPPDERKLETVFDGEYLVLTDKEADEWEREGLESLFDDMTSGVPDNLSGYLDVDRFIEDNGNNRGENISGYDGQEHQQDFDGVTYYIYRNN